MATIKNLVKFAAKFLDMAKAKGKDKKKTAAPKAGKSKPVAKKTAKPVKKVLPKAKKVAKPVKAKAKPVAKKAKPVAKAKVKAVKPKAKVVAKKPVKKVVATAKKAKVTEKPAPKKAVKAVKPVAKPVVKKSAPVVVAKPQVVKTASKPEVKPAPQPVAKAPVKQVQKSNMKQKENENNDLNLRYSDEELKEFKDLIDKKLAAAREELKNLKEALDNHTESQAGNKAWNMEEGTDTSEMEYLMNQISRQHQYIRNLELALIRVENKTYGICRVSGKLIPKERLRIVPHATLSLEAKVSRKTDEEVVGAGTTAPPADFSEGFED